jgi:hypothetical protein
MRETRGRFPIGDWPKLRPAAGHGQIRIRHSAVAGWGSAPCGAV